MSTGKKVALVAVPLVLLGVGAAVVFGGGGSGPQPIPPRVVEVAPDTPAPRPTEPATTTTSAGNTAPSALVVTFNTTPPGAAIFEGDEQLGTTPIKLEMPRDKSHLLSFRLAGHKSEERTLNFSRVAGDTQTVDVTLEPIRAAAPPKPKGKPAPSGPEINVFE